MNIAHKITAIGLTSALSLASFSSFADSDYSSYKERAKKNNSITINLPNATQAPVWPPSEIVDKDGNFIVVGTLLRDKDGVVTPEIGAALVSPETVPPLNEHGVEDFTNPMGSSYTIVRDLDLTKGSSDLDLELFTLSYGPTVGSFGGGGRIPVEGTSTYNLNGLPDSCPEIFPSESQKYTYKRESFPLNRAPVLGFQGDQVAYDVDSGIPFDPMLASGKDCGAGCSGENNVDNYPLKNNVTLGEWLEGKATLNVKLKDWDRKAKAYTAAVFKVKLRHAVPNGVYTVWLPRANTAANQGQSSYRQPTPAGLPNIIITDKHGNGSLTFKLENPFPAPEVDEQQVRVVGMAIDFHSDYQNWGACFSRIGAGVDIHAQWVSFADGTADFTDFVTVSK